MPNIPAVIADIDVTKEDAVNLILASIAFEELGQAHLINAEAEKIQYVLGTLEECKPEHQPTFQQLLDINESVRKTLKTIIKNQMLLQAKLEDTVDFACK